MNILPYLVLAAIEFNTNVTEMLNIGFLNIGFGVYLDAMGSLFWGIITLGIAAGLYVGSDKSILTLFWYFVIIGIIFTALVPSIILALFYISLALITGYIWYKTYLERKI